MILLHSLRAICFKQLRDVALDFPPNGSVLIEGHNEAGKSTLFEAVFFALYGKPLDSAANQDELKTYHAEEMSVELVFSVDGRRITVRRTLKANQACAMEWIDPEGAPKALKGATAVNQRIREEIGLSAGTLLNTCFVEQKNLERLESLDRNQRRDAINELLNLRVLTQLEAEFKIGAEDRREEERLKARVEVAELDDAIPRLRAAERVATECEQWARLAAIVRQMSAWEVERTSLADERETLSAQRTGIAEQLYVAAQMSARRDGLRDNLAVRVASWERAEERAAAADKRLEDLAAQAKELPALEARLGIVAGAAERARRREADIREEGRIAVAATEAANILADAQNRASAWQQRVDKLREALPGLKESSGLAESEVQDASRVAAEADMRAALTSWAEAVERCGEAGPAEGGAGLGRREEEARSRRDSSRTVGKSAANRTRFGWIAAGVGALVMAGGVAIPSLLLILMALGLALLAAGGVVAFRSTAAARQAVDSEREAQRELDRIEGERTAFAAQAEQAKRDGDEWRGRAESLGRRLHDLGAEIPESPRLAREKCDSLTTTPVGESRSAANQAQSTFNEAKSKLDATRSRLDSEIESPVSVSPDLAARLEELTKQRERLRNEIDSADDIAEVAATLGIENDLDAIEREAARVRDAAASARAAESELTASQQESLKSRSAAARLQHESGETWLELMPMTDPPNSPAAAISALNVVVAELSDKVDRAGVPTLQKEVGGIDARIQDIDVLSGTLSAQLGTAAGNANALGDKLGRQAGSPVDAAWLEQTRLSQPDLAEADTRDSEEWSQLHRESRIQIESNRQLRDSQAKRYDILEESLALAEERESLAAKKREMAVKSRAGEIVRATRASIVSRVMPLTLQNMRRMLPLLTDGRYHDAEWNEETNALTVFDNEARRHVSKRVFSGGAKDQISLSLRLAFALATLPSEFSTRPGWLFLDEPLSSFDRSRTQKLVDLLTRGLVRNEFDQILLVSHSESFDPGQFDIRLRIEAGRILTGDLRDHAAEPILA